LVSHQFKQEYEEETWRHTTIDIIAHRYQYLDICALSTARVPGFERVRHLGMRVNGFRADFWEEKLDDGPPPGSERFPEAFEVLEREIKSLMPKLSALKTLHIEMEGVALALIESIQNRRYDHLRLFDDKSHKKLTQDRSADHGVSVSASYMLNQELWSVHEDAAEDVEEGLAEELQSNDDNHIHYLATKASGDAQQDWYGLGFETLRAGTFDYEYGLDEYSEFKAVVRERDDDEHGNDSSLSSIYA